MLSLLAGIQYLALLNTLFIVARALQAHTAKLELLQPPHIQIPDYRQPQHTTIKLPLETAQVKVLNQALLMQQRLPLAPVALA
jgi:hypothetical protein